MPKAQTHFWVNAFGVRPTRKSDICSKYTATFTKMQMASFIEQPNIVASLVKCVESKSEPYRNMTRFWEARDASQTNAKVM